MDGNGNIWISDNAGAIFEFANSANGNVAPLKSILGSSTLMNQPYSLTLNGMVRQQTIHVTIKLFFITADSESVQTIAKYRRFATLSEARIALEKDQL